MIHRPEVDDWFEHYDNPMKPIVLRPELEWIVRAWCDWRDRSAET